VGQRYAGAVRVAALALLWGSSFLWIAIGLRGFSPVQITFARMALGAIVLLVILRWQQLKLPKRVASWGHLGVAALFGNVIPYLLFSLAEQGVSSSTAGVINASTPLWTVLFTVLAYRDQKAARRNVASLVLGFAGVVLIFSPWRLGTEITTWYGLACLAAAISYGISYVYISHFLTRRKIGVLPGSTGQLLCATVITMAALPFGLEAPSWRTDAVIAVVVLGVLGTGIAYLLNYQIISDDGPAAASVVTYLLPVVAVILGATVLQEPLQPQVLLGMAVVLVGVWLRRSDRPQSTR